MSASPCSPPLALADRVHHTTGVSPQIRRRGSIEHADKRKNNAAALHVQQTIQHGNAIWSKALTPSMEITVACGFCAQALQNMGNALAPSTCRQCVLVGCGGAFNAFPICCAMVLETNRRITSPATIPRTPLSGLRNAVIRSTRTASTTTCGTLACANRSDIWKKRVQNARILGEGECGRRSCLMGLQRLLSWQIVDSSQICPRREQVVCVGHGSPHHQAGDRAAWVVSWTDLRAWTTSPVILGQLLHPPKLAWLKTTPPDELTFGLWKHVAPHHHLEVFAPAFGPSQRRRRIGHSMPTNSTTLPVEEVKPGVRTCLSKSTLLWQGGG